MSWSDFEAMARANERFDEMTQTRHEAGAEKYGPFKFFEVDSIEMALEELADLANYVRYTFIKLHMLREQVAGHVPPPRSPLGVEGVQNPYGG